MSSLLGRVDALFRGLSLADFWERVGRIHGNRVLVRTETGGRTAAELAGEVERWADALRPAIRVGQPVVIAMPNGYDLFLACFAVARAGGIPAPVNDQMTEVEIDHVIADAGASLVIRSTADLDAPRPSRRRGRARAGGSSSTGAPAALFYTSGTTGMPKGVALSDRSLVGQLALGVFTPPGMVGEVLVALPVAHIMGFAVLCGLAISGTPVIFRPRFVASEVLDLIEVERPAGFVGVPAMFRKLEAAGAADRDLSSVRVWMSGADAMPGDLARAFKSYGSSVSLPLIGGVGEATFVEGYGMVEVGGGIAVKMSPPFLPIGVGDSLGFRLPGYRFRVVDQTGAPVLPGRVGELLVKGPGVLEGYWNDAEATAEVLDSDGWLRTGDLVRSGPAGTVIFSGRAKAVVKSGGYSVYPLEVETVLGEHPAVQEAAVVGLPHRDLGEVPAAAVIVAPRRRVTEAELIEWAEERLSHFKVPRRVIFVDELPRTGTAKVDRSRVRELFAAPARGRRAR